jgi:hypothetical protein
MENNNQLYIQNSRSNIDNFIYKKEFQKAFALLILVLERLNDTEKVEFIDYYSKNLTCLIMGISPLEMRV